MGTRRPVAAKNVPTGSPSTTAPVSAAAAFAAEVRTTGMPDPVAIATEASFVTMPPVPTVLPRPVTTTLQPECRTASTSSTSKATTAPSIARTSSEAAEVRSKTAPSPSTLKFSGSTAGRAWRV